MSWKADYNLVAAEKNDVLDLIGWVTISNRTGKVLPGRKVVVLLDVSGSMGKSYESDLSQRGLRFVRDHAQFLIYRFSDGLQPGGDLGEGIRFQTAGSTELERALQQLQQELRIMPDEMILVTDGDFGRAPSLGKLRNHVEVGPDELLAVARRIVETGKLES